MLNFFYQPGLTIFSAVSAAIAVLIASASSDYFVLAIVLVFGFICCVISKYPRHIIFLSLIFVISFAYAKCRLPRPTDTDISQYMNQVVLIKGRVSEVSKPSATGSVNKSYLKIQVSEMFFPARKNISGQARLIVTSNCGNVSKLYELGQELWIKAQVEPINRYHQPWLCGVVSILARQGIFCQMQICESDILKSNELPTKRTYIENVQRNICSLIDNVRQTLADAHLKFLGAKSGSLMASMVLGDQAVCVNSELIDAFKKVGLSHIVAASGFNLTVITMITFWIARLLIYDKRLSTFVVSVNVLIYALLAGFSASIVRAAIMCMLLLITKYFNRHLNGPAALSLGLLVNIIIDPAVLVEPGGQLSYVATAGIVCGANRLANFLSFGFKGKIVNALATLMAVVCMAQFAVLPVQLFHFWQTGLLFLPANILIDPFVTPVTIIGFLASIVSLVNLPSLHAGLGLCYCLDWIVALPLHMIISVAEYLASYNGAIVTSGRPFIGAIIFYYIALIGWLFCLDINHYRLAATTIFIVSIGCLFYQPILQKPIVIVLPHSFICINRSRQALCCGEEDKLTNKILAYYGSSQPKEQTILLANSSEERITADKKGRIIYLTISKAHDTAARQTYSFSLGQKNVSKGYKNMFVGRQYLLGGEFAALAKSVELKICCPNKVARFYFCGESTSFNSSVL